ncbi:MAG: winged helix-turn-helix domain-containing protein [Bryobacteraceae bacterium]
MSEETPKTAIYNNSKQLLHFGDFALEVTERRLTRSGQPVALPPKVFDLLVLLVQNAGRLMDKERLSQDLWPGTFVEESNLSVNVSALRKALGDGANGRFIETVPKKGYRWVAEVRTEEPATPIPAVIPQARRSLRWPVALAAVALIAVVATGWWWWQHRTVAVRSIAVLPFTPVIEDDAQRSIGLGMADAVITRLSALGKLEVRPTSAVLRYLKGSIDTSSAGRELKVDLVLHGGVQTVDKRIRVSVQLVRVEDGKQLWSDTFDDYFTNIFAVQDNIAERVAAALSVPMSASQQEALSRRSTENTQAYEFYLKGQYLASKRLHEATAGAIDYFEKAIAADPDYPAPYAALASSALIRAGEGFPGNLREKAKNAAIKAISLDDKLAEAHLALGQVLMRSEWDWHGAERAFRHAIELNRNLAMAHAAQSTLWTALGRHEDAIREMEITTRLDPGSASLRSDYSWALLFARRPGEALVNAQKSVDLDEWSYSAHRQFGKAYLAGGQHAEAIAEAQKALNINGGRRRRVVLELGKAYAAAGRRSEAEAALRETLSVGGQEPDPHYEFAVLYAALGDKPNAIKSLERACQQRLSRVIWMGADPELDGLREEPGFRRLLESLHLPSK